MSTLTKIFVAVIVVASLPQSSAFSIRELIRGGKRGGDSSSKQATRPPVEETSAFLKALLTAHGKDFLVKVFGPKAKDELVGMGGVDKVAVALSQIPTADLFGIDMKLSDEETEHMIAVLEGILNGSTDELTSNEAADFRFFVQKLQETGFF
nr:Prohormone-4 [Haemonchus contortus]